MSTRFIPVFSSDTPEAAISYLAIAAGSFLLMLLVLNVHPLKLPANPLRWYWFLLHRAASEAESFFILVLGLCVVSVCCLVTGLVILLA
ncbi:hypothetical protein [Chitinolyticbacter meiyuanensis]|uniref:hypothetical protein n=1 Tax=Chitinolyticbacter meiyuanensis TaxID=682798 RepID=UPI0011E5BA9D|nr:hypothetical protein [Chitinolyticbacter meiyuanensis]